MGEQGEIRVGAWDCSSCGHRGNSGNAYACQGCGRARPDDVVFYLPEDAPVVTDPEAVAEALVGGDWLCQFCDYYNRATVQSCAQCGAPRTAENASLGIGDWAPTEEVPRTGDEAERQAHPDRQRRFARRPAEAGQGGADSRPRPVGRFGRWPRAWWAAAGAIVLVALAAGLYFQFIRQHGQVATVSGFSWSRTIEQDVYGTVRDEGWTLPSEARLVSRSSRVHGYNHVLDHYETKTRRVAHTTYQTEHYSCSRSLGNGKYQKSSCSRQVPHTSYTEETYREPVYRDDPVYAPWYVYDIDRWHSAPAAQASGRDQLPHWPTVVADSTHRKAGQKEEYIAYFSAGKRQYHKSLPEAVWQQLRQGQRVTLKVNQQGDVASVAVTH